MLKTSTNQKKKRCYPNGVQVNIALAMPLFANSFQEKRQYDANTASTYIWSNHGEDPAIAKAAAVVLIYINTTFSTISTLSLEASQSQTSWVQCIAGT